MEERMFGHSSFETFRLEDLSGKCDLCEEFKTLEEDERRLKWELVAMAFFTLIVAIGIAVIIREHWIVRWVFGGYFGYKNVMNNGASWVT